MPQVQETSAHVGQPAPSTHAGSMDTARSGRPTSAPANRHRKFATLLDERERGSAPGAGVASPAARLITVSSEAAGRRQPTPAAAAPLEAPHRLLLGDAPGCDSAWLRIEGGRFAGAEIHLSVAGSRVEVCFLTPHEASRQTLAIAMQAVRNRLRARGLMMVEATSPPRDRRRGAAGETRRSGDDQAEDHAANGY